MTNLLTDYDDGLIDLDTELEPVADRSSPFPYLTSAEDVKLPYLTSAEEVKDFREYQRLSQITTSALNEVIAKQQAAIAERDRKIAQLNNCLLEELFLHRQTLQTLLSAMSAKNLALQQQVERLSQP